jgi:hypothetical protein
MALVAEGAAKAGKLKCVQFVKHEDTLTPTRDISAELPIYGQIYTGRNACATLRLLSSRLVAEQSRQF